jgi:hypothetical protein
MKRHRFDAVSLVLGLLALAVGIAAWAGRLGRLINEPSAAIPLAVGLVGVALIASARRPAQRDADADT